MQIEVHAVDAEVARPDAPHQRVEVRPVAVEIRAGRVQRRRLLQYLVLEQAAGVGVGQHEGRDVRPEARLERDEVDPAAVVVRYRLHGVAANVRGRRVGAVRRVGHQHHLARVALRLQRGADRHQPAQLAMRAGAERHGDGRHASQHFDPVRERVDERERALHAFDRLQRVDVGEAGKPREALVEPGVVLHGATAQRVYAHVDAVVLLRQARVVADRLGLGKAGEADRPRALLRAQPVGERRGRVEIDARLVGPAALEDQRLGKLQAAMRLRRPAHNASPSAAAKRAMSSSVLVSVAATSRRFASAGSSG